MKHLATKLYTLALLYFGGPHVFTLIIPAVHLVAGEVELHLASILQLLA